MQPVPIGDMPLLHVSAEAQTSDMYLDITKHFRNDSYLMSSRTIILSHDVPSTSAAGKAAAAMPLLH